MHRIITVTMNTDEMNLLDALRGEGPDMISRSEVVRRLLLEAQAPRAGNVVALRSAGDSQVALAA